MSIRHLILVASLVAIIGGCAGQGAQLSSGNPPSAAADSSEPPTGTSTEPPGVEVTDAPTEPDPTTAPTPDDGAPTLFRAGDVVTVTQGDEPYLDIVVSNIGQKQRYGSGYFVDRPKKGNIYIQAQISYKALADGATYNPFDWQVFCDDEAVDDFTFVSDGPEPRLSSGTLPRGRKAKGWVVYEVPAKGRCLLSYGANSFISQGAVFEVLLRSK